MSNVVGHVQNIASDGINQPIALDQRIERGRVLPFSRPRRLSCRSMNFVVTIPLLIIRLQPTNRVLFVSIQFTSLFIDSHVHSPVFTSLVPPLVGLVGSKDQEESEETRRERKGIHGKLQDGCVLPTENSGVNIAHQIHVLACEHVP